MKWYLDDIVDVSNVSLAKMVEEESGEEVWFRFPKEFSTELISELANKKIKNLMEVLK